MIKETDEETPPATEQRLLLRRPGNGGAGEAEPEPETRLSRAIREIRASRARAAAVSLEIAHLKTETRSVLAQIEANLK
jgi:hypothetical protein